jgi:hypothetical protein
MMYIYFMQNKLMNHLKKNASSYAIGLLLSLFLLLCILIGVICSILERFWKIPGFIGTIIVSYVYGYGILLIISYVSFHLVARPVAALMEHRFFSLHRIVQDLLIGTAYGAAIGTCIVMFFRSANAISWIGTVLFLVFGLLVGILNWIIYRKLIGINS